MNPFATLSYQTRRLKNKLSGLLARKWKTGFYLYLAGLFSVLIMADTAYLHLTANMKQSAFDMMVKYRLVVPNPDKNIVIVDIDE
ncbi:MAG: molecular chaperone TorD, partial [Gallionella sp.]